ncbi:hyphally-regulated protein-like [Camellia sinensis]|uniref:hyphally-regulated protein-like n=1 Tax=Camellia sinensis TaxID=4442 RepID=UPI001035B0ED|nr:hyphally-regulated protein-like [Camellia sinensis]
MGIVQRRETLFGLHSIPISPMPVAPAVVAAPIPAVPPLAAGRRERQAPVRGQGRAKGARAENGPSEPILSDDVVETSDSEEAASQQLESSESGGDDAGSGSKSGGDDVEEGSGAESRDSSGSDSGLEGDSDSGADGDSAPESSPPRKRTKRASRA